MVESRTGMQEQQDRQLFGGPGSANENAVTQSTTVNVVYKRMTSMAAVEIRTRAKMQNRLVEPDDVVTAVRTVGDGEGREGDGG
jgi:hypothetical protein